jgi:hypothetical protein
MKLLSGPALPAAAVNLYRNYSAASQMTVGPSPLSARNRAAQRRASLPDCRGRPWYCLRRRVGDAVGYPAIKTE